MDFETARRQLRLSLGLAAIVAAGAAFGAGPVLGLRPGGVTDQQIRPTVQAPQMVQRSVHVRQAQINLP